MSVSPILVAGSWREAVYDTTFQAVSPATGQLLDEQFPLSRWSDIDAALEAAAAITDELRWAPGDRLAAFLEAYAGLIEERATQICEAAHAETALPLHPRLVDAELPRTIGQLRQAADAARTASWRRPVVDHEHGLRTCRGAIGPVAVFGPNNFPLAFGSISGGDFASAIAAGNPVIAKAHSSHPATTRLFAEAAFDAVAQVGLPAATVQLLYRIDHADGERLVSDRRLGATGYTGSRAAGLKLKAAADRVGKPIYLELSSINPVVMLPTALVENLDQVVDEFVGSCLLGAGQFCTNPGLVIAISGNSTDAWVTRVAERFAESPVGVLLSAGVLQQLKTHLDLLVASGAQVVTGHQHVEGEGFRYANTLLRVSGDDFLANPSALQTEVFGPAALVVVAKDSTQLLAILQQLEGNLTGTIYHTSSGGCVSSGDSDGDLAVQVARVLRPRVGRLLHDRMPTGVAVSRAMNHGGPFPATGHPGFTAVGVPAAIERFSQLWCFDHAPSDWLPDCLRASPDVPGAESGS